MLKFQEMGNINTKTFSEPESSPIIRAEGLTKSYATKVGHVRALQNISLTIEKGEFVAIVGSSGSGKSTLLQVLGGLEPSTAGSLEVNGVNIGKLNERKRALFRQANIGFVFQFFYLQPFLTLRQNIELPQLFVSNPRDASLGYVEKLADTLGIGERMDHLPRELSGGQIQRAAIARALVNNPPIILADEPTGNLDYKSAQITIDLFAKIRSEFDTTIIVVTHDERIASSADRVITIVDGHIA